MKYSTIVLTCGVSVFGCSNVFRKWSESNSLLAFPSAASFNNPAPPRGRSEQETLEILRRGLSYPGVLDKVIADGMRVSAEYSALKALQQERRLAGQPAIVLIHTATFGGRAAAAILEFVLQEKFRATVECVECPMNVNDREQLRYDLGNFMQKVADALRYHDPRSTCFFPLGGYKVMTFLGALAGGYFGFPTLYLHEEKQVFQELPGVPWKLDQATLERIAPLMKLVGVAYEFKSLTEEQQKMLGEYSWLFERVGDCVAVNAFGLFIMQENPRLFGTKLLVDQEVDRACKNDRQRAFVEQQLGVLAGKLAAGVRDPDLRHELTWEIKSEDWHLYKGASNGQLVLRAIYLYDASEKTLTIRKVWTSHDAYAEQFKAEWQRPLAATVEWSLS